MSRLRIYRGTRPSRGAIRLGRAMRVPVLRRDTRYRPRRGDTIINWGTTEGFVFTPGVRAVNHPYACGLAVDKLASYERFKAWEVPTPDWTTDREEAETWEGLVVCRTMLRASAGRGIVLAEAGDLPAAPLYTSYFKARDEFRVHVVGGYVVDRQQKRRRRNDDGETNASNEIRNVRNGWIFCRDDVEQIDSVDDAARGAVSALGLDFGAVDIKCNQQRTRCAVLEVNTAPGLEGSTLESYGREIRRMV